MRKPFGAMALGMAIGLLSAFPQAVMSADAAAATSKVPDRFAIHEWKLDNVVYAARRGTKAAMHDLCYRYRYGKSAPQDDGKALQWCTRAAEEGLSSSQTLLAEIYENGRGVAVNDATAFRWYSAAAEQGHDHANLRLYTFYKEGRGVAASPETALRHLRAAADSGYDKAIEKMKEAEPSWRAAPETPLQGAASETGALEQDIPAGHYQAEDFHFNPGATLKLTVLLQKSKAHEKWMPMQSVCIRAEAPTKSLCLRFTNHAADKQLLHVSKFVLAEQMNGFLGAEETFASFAFGPAIALEVSVRDGRVHFLVNGSIAVSNAVDFVPDMLTLGCSSATCSTRFN